MNTPAWEALRAFRQQVYTLFGCRRDALFELLDALLTASSIETPAHLSLAPSCQRGWGSLYDALNAGTMDLSQLERLIASYPLSSESTWYALDASVWPRCDAETSPARGYYAHPYRHSHGQPIVAGWNYSWLVQLPTRCSSWTAPLRVRRLIPGENVNTVAAEQIRSWLGAQRPLLAEAGAAHRPRDGRPDLQLRRRLRFGAVESGPGRRTSTNQSACWCACALVAASTRTRRRSRSLAARGGTGRSSSAPIPRPGLSRPTSGRATIPAMGGSASARGGGCMPPHKTMRHAAHANHVRSCVGR